MVVSTCRCIWCWYSTSLACVAILASICVCVCVCVCVCMCMSVSVFTCTLPPPPPPPLCPSLSYTSLSFRPPLSNRYCTFRAQLVTVWSSWERQIASRSWVMTWPTSLSSIQPLRSVCRCRSWRLAMLSAMVGSWNRPSMLQNRYRSCSRGNKLLKLYRYVSANHSIHVHCIYRRVLQYALSPSTFNLPLVVDFKCTILWTISVLYIIWMFIRDKTITLSCDSCMHAHTHTHTHTYTVHTLWTPPV